MHVRRCSVVEDSRSGSFRGFHHFDGFDRIQNEDRHNCEYCNQYDWQNDT